LEAGEPFGESFSFSQVMAPAALAWPPFEFKDPSKSARPPRPLAGSTKPAAAMSVSFNFMVASKGVLAQSWGLMGPALPDTLALPPPGRLIVKSNGNCEVEEKFVTSTFTLSYTCGFVAEFTLPTISFPSLISSLATEKFWGVDAPDFSDSGAFGVPVPGLEKFHVPLVALSKVI
jgi:hypothetical protein